LGNEWRPVGKAKSVAMRLTCKAASRLRRLGYYATKFYFSVRTTEGKRIAYEKHFYRSNDNFTLLANLYEIWAKMLSEHSVYKIKKISVTFFGLVEKNLAQDDMLILLDSEHSQRQKKHESLSEAMDKLNAKFGRDSIVIGEVPQKLQKFSGTKIAFTRIPDMEEFWE
jgi:DNA polymerase-4